MIRLFKVNMSPDVDKYLSPILQSGYIGEGEEVVKFEKELIEFLFPLYKIHKLSIPVSTNSCTSAIYLSLLALGVDSGDEVITTPMTCTATNSPIVLLGARPIWADVNPLTGNISTHLEHLITKRTKAIIAVDWTGRRCNYHKLREYKIPVIEDAAHGPQFNPSNCGDMVCLSFGPIKHLTSGDGGAIILSGDDTYEMERKLKLLRWYGLDRTSTKDFRCQQNIDCVGGKFHMNNINAAIGRANLLNLDRVLEKFGQNAFFLWSNIDHKNIYVPEFSPHSDYWVFPIIIRYENRDKFVKYMIEKRIEVSRVHARNDRHWGFKYPFSFLPGLEEFDKGQVNIPCGNWVTKEEIKYIVKTINEWET